MNNDLLPNKTLELGFPWKIAVETARKWMYELGFEVEKDTFVNGCECEDVYGGRFPWDSCQKAMLQMRRLRRHYPLTWTLQDLS